MGKKLLPTIPSAPLCRRPLTRHGRRFPFGSLNLGFATACLLINIKRGYIVIIGNLQLVFEVWCHVGYHADVLVVTMAPGKPIRLNVK